MKLSEKLFKYATIGFISLIAILLMITMGMPSVGSYSSQEDKFMAATVGSEKITRQDLDRVFRNMMSQQFQGIDLPPEFQAQFKTQALNQLIDQRLFYLLSVDAGLYPLPKSSDKILVNYLKENFSDYLIAEGFDFEKFENERLRPNRISMDQIRQSAEWSYALSTNDTIFREIATAATGRDVLDNILAQKTTISYEILHISPAQRKEINRRRAKITEADIRAKFAADYLSQNPDDVLTEVKRDAITEALLQERIGDIESKWMAELSGNTSSLTRTKSLFGGTLVSLKNISLDASLQGANQVQEVNLTPLESNIEFLEKRVRQGSIIGPVDVEGSLYVVRITTVKTPADLSAGSTDNLPDGELEQIKTTLSNMYVDALYRQMFDFSRRHIKVIRYVGQ